MTRKISDDIVKPITSAARAALAEFLSRSDRPEDWLSLGEVQGFFFTVAASPDVVPPSEWLPIVFGGQPPQFETREEAELIMGTLLSLYNEINTDVREGEGRLPPEVELRDNLLANLEFDAPVAEWSRGFVEGHLWLQEIWDEFTPDLPDEMLTLFWTLGFFATSPIVEDLVAAGGDPERTLDVVVAEAADLFVDAASAYADIGLHLRDVLRHQRTKPEEGEFIRPGRNDPCTCGSLKKYKKCCGRIAQA